MKRSFKVFLQFGFWICYFILVIVVLGIIYGRDPASAETKIEKALEPILTFVLIPSAISFYSFYYFVFPKLLSKKKYLVALIVGLVISYCAGVFGFLLTQSQNINTSCSIEARDSFIPISIFIGFICFVCGVIALIIRGFVTWFEEVQHREILAIKNHEMEMALVKSQLDPHFLFNTINNIDVLILRDAEKASNYLNHLSDIMRFMLFETKSDEIPLSREIEYIEKYIELQRIRTANELYVNFTVKGDISGKKIAPMVFIPFIENAFKHTSNKKIEHAITVSIEISSTEIKMICENKYDPNRPSQESNGLGNTLISKRLSLLYPTRHSLNINNQNNCYSVTLVIKNG
jgi:two-component system, LytTR family, sensor kinase